MMNTPYFNTYSEQESLNEGKLTKKEKERGKQNSIVFEQNQSVSAILQKSKSQTQSADDELAQRLKHRKENKGILH